MDYSSLVQYLNKRVRLTLVNGFWFKALILEVSEQAITFTELKGRKMTVDPKQIMMIEEALF